uniref:DNA-directed RNA polymerase n=1 Tax=Zea mays TaxID=4577 RepID=A0A804MXN3_MAIZE
MAQLVENPILITHCSQLHDNPSLGLPLQVGGSCESYCCSATQLDNCEGHFGFIKLPVPIYHPSHITELGRYSTSSASASRNPRRTPGKNADSPHVHIASTFLM